MLKAIDVAKAFVFLQNTQNADNPENTEQITQLKIQKLCYYAQAHFLLYYDKPLFAEKIEAWKHGPVVAEIYDNSLKADDLCQKWSVKKEDFSHFTTEEKEIISYVFAKYGGYTAYRLRDMTHEEAPYIKNYDEKNKHAQIPNDDILEYFKERRQAHAKKIRLLAGLDD